MLPSGWMRAVARLDDRQKLCMLIGMPPVCVGPTSMWLSPPVEEPTKPIAPMPMALPSVLSSRSRSAIFGSGLRSPTTRRQAGRFARCMQLSFGSPPPRPMSAGGGGVFAELHAAVLGAAQADADDGGLAGQSALAEGDQRVEHEAFDAGDAIARE